MSRWLREKLNGYGVPVAIIGVLLTLVLAPVAYLRADICDARDKHLALQEEIAGLKAQHVVLDARWEIINTRLAAIEADVRFLRELAVKGDK